MSEITLCGFFRDPDFDFQARIALGQAGSGVGDVGLVVATLDRIVDGDSQSWFDAWTAAANQQLVQAEAARDAGHWRTARSFYLAASDYFHRALAAIDGLRDPSPMLPTFAAQQRCWEAMIDSSEGRFVRVAIPYEPEVTLAGYLLRPDASGAPRPTLVMTNGSDGSLSSLLGYGASEALARGWNAFVYDGPGQQSALFAQNIPFRFDWEAVLTPVIDVLEMRSDVDATALTGYGISQGGYWLPRALAFEHRLVAAVADSGVVDVSTGWTRHLPPKLLELLYAGDKDAFNAAIRKAADPAKARALAMRGRPYGASDPYELFSTVLEYHVRDVAGLIRTPLLITDPDDEQFFPGQPRELFDLLPEGNDKELLHFGRDVGANMHCQPLARRLTDLLMFDWLEERLPGRRLSDRPSARVAAWTDA